MKYLHKPPKYEYKSPEILAFELNLCEERLENEKSMSAQLYKQVELMKMELRMKNAEILKLKEDMELLKEERHTALRFWTSQIMKDMHLEDLENL